MHSTEPFDPESFRAQAHAMADHLADYLAEVHAQPVLRSTPPEALHALVPGEFGEAPGGDLIERLQAVIRHSIHVHHPRYLGHQVAAVVPGAVLAEMVAALLNNGMAIYEMGQMHTVMERQLVRFLVRELGYPEGAGGILTGGGSVGNLTALLAARQLKAKNDVWKQGQEQRYAVLVSEESHYSVTRAVQIMGWGSAGVFGIPTGDDFAVRPEALGETLARARAAGREVLALVASACSTATGSFDPIDAMADFCAAEGLWLHVDGAHGASFVLSPEQRPLLAGIERADSVVWDLHKMMMLPATVSAVLYKDASHAQAAFAQQASYLYEEEAPEARWYDIGQRTLECTKRGMACVAHSVLHHYGLAVFREHLAEMVALTQAMARAIEAAPDFELACEPACNILCFRFVAPAEQDSNQLQARLRADLLREGRFYVVQATLRGRLYLRMTLVNPGTKLADLLALLEELRRLARLPAPPLPH